MKDGWHGVDLDGTLAFDIPGPHAPDTIGAPVPAMVARVKQWLAEGKEVRIFTARVATDGSLERDRHRLVAWIAIRAWSLEHIGVILDVTCIKDWCCEQIWDDRAIQVIKNTGERVGTVDRQKREEEL